MPVDPECQALLDAMAAADLPDIVTLTPIEARARTARTRDVLPQGPDVARTENFRIDVAGGSIALRAYFPLGDPIAVMVYFHGGGWVVGGIEESDGPNRLLANETGCVVLSVDYRLAPEFPFPIPVDDSYAATVWAAAHRDLLGGAALPVIVCGDSAGASIAGAVALLAKDRGGPDLALQILLYPATDAACDTESFALFGVDKIPTSASLKWFWNHYAPTDAQRFHPLASLLRAPDLAGLPPALIQTAEFDPLRDEGEAYAERLARAGVPVVCERRAGMIHGYITFAQILTNGRAAIGSVARYIRQSLS